MKLGILMFFGLLKLNLKLDFEISKMGGSQEGEEGKPIFYYLFAFQPFFMHFCTKQGFGILKPNIRYIIIAIYNAPSAVYVCG